MRRYLCLYLPRWPLQRLQNEPSFISEQKPAETGVALYERTAHGPRLLVCSSQAGKLGVKRGMLLADATALAPQLAVYEMDRRADRRALEELGLWASRFSPLTAIESCPVPALAEHWYPQTLLLDITGCADVFHGENNLLQQALSSLAKKDLKARAAIAPTIGAAWALAHYGASGSIVGTPEHEMCGTGRPTERLLAPADCPCNSAPDSRAIRATKRRGAACPCHTQTQPELTQALAPLPLSALRLDPEALEWLHKLGLYRIGELLKQPRSTLPSRFGKNILERLDQASGAAPETLTLLRPPPEFMSARAFEYPIKELSQLLAIMESLVVQIAADLQRGCRGARQLECWLYHELSAPMILDVSLHTGSASEKHLLQLLRTRLEDVQTKLQLKQVGKARTARRQDAGGKRQDQNRDRKGAPSGSPLPREGEGLGVRGKPGEIERITIEAESGICAVSLRVNASEPLDAQQLALFHQALHAPEKLSMTLDRISMRLGEGTVWRVELAEDAQPEAAYRLVPVGRVAPAALPAGTEAGTTARPTRPLQLMAQPQPVVLDWPDQSAWPHAMEWRGRREAIVRACGPERIETGWWKPFFARRDYYLIECQTGSRYWLFRRLDDGQWFVHGVFE
ncbi:MAG TPA: DNA polymerase Y family protein [Planctomycetota bacterium]|jgi:protein ImuB